MSTIVPCDLLHVVPAMLFRLKKNPKKAISPPVLVAITRCKRYQDQNPRKHSVKRHRMPGYAVEGGNPKENWRHFKKHVELMLTGPPKYRTEEYKYAVICVWVGQKGRTGYLLQIV